MSVRIAMPDTKNFDILRAKARAKITDGSLPADSECPYQYESGLIGHKAWCALCGEAPWLENEWWVRLILGAKPEPELHFECYVAWRDAAQDKAP